MDSEKRDGNSSGTDPQGLAEPRAPLLAVEERVQHLPVCWVPEGSPRLWVSLGRVGGQLSPTPACLGKGWAEPRETESRPSPSMSETRVGGDRQRELDKTGPGARRPRRLPWGAMNLQKDGRGLRRTKVAGWAEE